MRHNGDDSCGDNYWKKIDNFGSDLYDSICEIMVTQCAEMHMLVK